VGVYIIPGLNFLPPKSFLSWWSDNVVSHFQAR
jgi:hypothetical protein